MIPSSSKGFHQHCKGTGASGSPAQLRRDTAWVSWCRPHSSPALSTSTNSRGWWQANPLTGFSFFPKKQDSDAQNSMMSFLTLCPCSPSPIPGRRKLERALDLLAHFGKPHYHHINFNILNQNSMCSLGWHPIHFMSSLSVLLKTSVNILRIPSSNWPPLPVNHVSSASVMTFPKHLPSPLVLWTMPPNEWRTGKRKERHLLTDIWKSATTGKGSYVTWKFEWSWIKWVT